MILVYHEQLAQEVITTRLHKVAAGQLNGEFTHILKRLSLLPPTMAGGYPNFCSMKQLRVFLLPPGLNANPLPQPYFSSRIYAQKCL